MAKKSTKAVKSTKTAIKEKALQLLEKHQEGLRYSELVKMISEGNASLKINTIRGNIWKLDQSNEVYKPIKGLFRLIKFKPTEEELSEPTEEDTQPIGPEDTDTKEVKEEDFYEPFADWLTKEIEDTTKAISLGGNVLKDKWGTPDVIGIFEYKDRAIIKPTAEVVTAEIKLDSSQLITAFGQACAYKLFSHKVYLVVPKQSKKEDI
ncbi:MAG: hypothetical protein NTW26_07010, partial [bacterium]|nr:hypothetical protein [bacterium]